MLGALVGKFDGITDNVGLFDGIELGIDEEVEDLLGMTLGSGDILGDGEAKGGQFSGIGRSTASQHSNGSA